MVNNKGRCTDDDMCPSVRVKGINVPLFRRQGYHRPHSITKGICIPFLIVQGYIYPFSHLLFRQRAFLTHFVTIRIFMNQGIDCKGVFEPNYKQKTFLFISH